MEGKATKDWRFWVFLILSVIWSSTVFWLLIEDQYFSGFSGAMPLNEVGDFLAGSFSPLAFAWLAYGYWMQNKELQLSRKALNQQIEEFKKSVDVQNEMAQIAYNNQEIDLMYKDIEHKRSQPHFIYNHSALSPPRAISPDSTTKSRLFHLELRNIGAQVTLFRILHNEKDLITPIENFKALKDYHFEINIDIPYTEPLNITFVFLDAMGIQQEINHEIIEETNGAFSFIINHSANRN